MARSLLEIVLQVTDKNAKRELKELDKQLDQVDDAAKKSSRGFSGLSTDILKMGAVIGGVTAGAVLAGKAIWNMGKQGAAVIQTGESFDFLIQKIGLAPDILDQLRKASRGTIDDMTLMSSTATLLAGTSDELGRELGNATPKLLEIAKAANKLNPSLGTTAQQYESIATGIKRASPLILDNLGLTISISQANEDYAEALGKTVEELTEEEKKIALLNATMKAGDNLIAQVGGTTESAADEFARMETNVTNLKNEIMKGLAPAIADVAGKTAGYLDVSRALNQAKEDGIYTDQEVSRITFDQIFAGKTNEQVLRDLENAYREKDRMVVEATGHERAYTDLVIEVTGHERAHELQMQANKEAMDGLTESTENIEEATRDYKQELSDLQLFVSGPLGKEYERFEEKQEDLREEMQKVQDEIDELNGMEHLTDEQRQDLEDAKIKYGELGEAYEENASEHDEATKRIMFNLLTQRAAMDELTSQELDQLNQIALEWGLLDQATFDYVEAADQYFQVLEDDSIETMGIVRWELEETLGIASEAQSAYDNLKSSLEGLSGTYDIKIRTFYEEVGKSEYNLPPLPGPPAPKQYGGHVLPKNWYVVGEKGPELFIPSVAGEIVPNNRIGTTSGTSRSLGGPSVIYNRGGDRVYIENTAAAAYLVEKQYQANIAEIDKVI